MGRRTLSRLTLLTGVLGAFTCASAIASQAIQGAVAEIQQLDADALGTSVACRVYSTVDSEINANFGGSCLNNRCGPRNYATLGGFGNPGGYICQGENTSAYPNAEAAADPGVTFYNVIDAEINAGASNHAAYYSVQGMKASSGVITNTGDFRQAGCAGTMQGANCFDRADTRFTTPLATTLQNGSLLRSLGGLSPVPQVKVSTGPMCWGTGPGPVYPAGTVCLSWEEPNSYGGAMKNGVPNPVTGVRLWKIETPLTSCGIGPSGNDPGWTSMGTFPLGAGASGTADYPTTGVCTYYALSIRFAGPGSVGSEIETGARAGTCASSTGFVGVNSAAVTGP